MKDLIIKLITAHTGISSKRVCGLTGWVVCLSIAVYCAITQTLAPVVTETILWCCMGLLGIDSVTNIWKNDNSKNYLDKRP